MDIRVVSESIFEINSDLIFYFVDNAFTNKDTADLISKAGDKILDIFSNISSIPTYEYEIVPAFDVKSIYISLIVLPKEILNESFEEKTYNLFEKIFSSIKKRKFEKIAIDLTRLEKNYSKKHSEILKKFLKDKEKDEEDIVVFFCK